MECVAETRGYVSKKHRICGQNTRNMCPKSTAYVVERFVAALCAALYCRRMLPPASLPRVIKGVKLYCTNAHILTLYLVVR